MRLINEIIVHCTATRPEWFERATTAQKVAEIRRWHVQDRGWKDIGYHYLIDRSGQVATGRPLEQIGAHVAGHNTGTVGIALFGGHGSAETDDISDNFTVAQEITLRDLIADLRKRFPTIKTVSGHNQYAAKACPGFYVPDWYEEKMSTQPDKEPAKGVSTPSSTPPSKGWLSAIIAAIAAFFGGKK